jgi:hypothetical protein
VRHGPFGRVADRRSIHTEGAVGADGVWSSEVHREPLQIGERAVVEGAFVRSPQNHAGAWPASSASCQRGAHKHQRPPGLRPGKPNCGIGVERSLPGKPEKRVSHDGADRVAADVFSIGVAATVTKESTQRVSRCGIGIRGHGEEEPFSLWFCPVRQLMLSAGPLFTPRFSRRAILAKLGFFAFVQFWDCRYLSLRNVHPKSPRPGASATALTCA